MRIIAGKFKSRTLKMPAGIRPTQNKVRKALFDILGNLEGLSFLDLFAGSGAVGLEALSRGASELALVEYNRDCLVAIKKNIESLKLTACTLYPLKVEKAIRTLYKDNKKFDIIFLDPPYYPERSYPNAEYRVSSKNNFGIPKHLRRSGCIRGRRLSGIPKRYRGNRPIEEQDLVKKTLQTLISHGILTRNGLIIVQHHKKEKLANCIDNLRLQRQEIYGDNALSFYHEKGSL